MKKKKRSSFATGRAHFRFSMVEILSFVAYGRLGDFELDVIPVKLKKKISEI